MASQQDVQIVISAKDEASKTIGNVGSSVRNLDGVFNDFITTAAGVTTAIAGVAAAFATKLVKDGLEAGIQMEQVRVAFNTMIGDADLAGQTLGELAEFAKETPFDLPTVLEGSKRLLAYGTTAQDLIPTFEMLGDVSAGLGTDKLPQLITAFGQVQAKGKLAGTELLQLTEAGFNVAEAMGVSREQLEEMTSSGEVSFEDLRGAFENVTSEGGRFFNLMENQSKTTGGAISNLKDQFFQFTLAIVGVDPTGVIVEGGLFDRFKQILQDILPVFEENKDGVNQIASAVAEALGPALEQLGEFIKNIDWKQFAKDVQLNIETLGLLLEIMLKVIKVFGSAKDETDSLSDKIYNLGQRHGEIIAKVIEFIQSLVNAVLQVQIFGQTVTSVFDTMVAPIQSAISWIETLADKVRSIPSSIDFSVGGLSFGDGANTGGIVTSSGIKKFADGGIVPGVGNRDTVPAMLTPGEIVVNPKRGQGLMNIEVNFNNPTVRSDNDLNTIVRAVESALTRNSQLQNIGI